MSTSDLGKRPTMSIIAMPHGDDCAVKECTAPLAGYTETVFINTPEYREEDEHWTQFPDDGGLMLTPTCAKHALPSGIELARWYQVWLSCHDDDTLSNEEQTWLDNHRKLDI